MLRHINFEVELFRSDLDTKRSRKALLWLMQALVKINQGYIRVYNPPSLYASDVVYRPESGTEVWKDIPTILRDGFGDCEDLACYRIAELNVAGIAAKPFIKWSYGPSGEPTKYHAVLRLPDGRIEDPSRVRGMHGRPVTSRPIFVDEGPSQ